MNAWRRALERAAWDGRIATTAADPNHLVINVDGKLDGALEHKQFGRPLALGTVVREAVSVKGLLPLQDFLKSKESIYHRSWTDLPGNLVSWVLSQVWPTGGVQGEDKLPGGEFVVARNVELVAKSLADSVSSTTSLLDSIFSKESFYRTFRETLISGKVLSETDVDVLLVFSSRDKGLLSYNGKVVKFNRTTDNNKPAITEEDAAIASLKDLIEHIKRQIMPLVAKVDALTASAKEAVARNDRLSALAALKTKKITEASLEKRYATLSQLEQVASKIEEAADHVQLVKVLEGSAGVLKSLNLKVGGAERAEEVMANLREQMSEVDEVGNIVTTAAMESSVVDEAEIDDELEEMAAQEKLKCEAVEGAGKAEEEKQEATSVVDRLGHFPAVPEEGGGEARQQQQSVTKEKATASATEGVRKLSLVEA